MSCLSTVNGKWVLSGSEDNQLYMWELNSCQIVGKLSGHTKPVLSCDAHPSDQVIVSGSLDKSIKLWRWSSDEQGVLWSPLLSTVALQFLGECLQRASKALRKTGWIFFNSQHIKTMLCCTDSKWNHWPMYLTLKLNKIISSMPWKRGIWTFFKEER